MTTIGYMRVSTLHQKFDSQKKALDRYGVDLIFQEYESGRKQERTQLNEALKKLKPGDTFVIYKLDRLARNTKQLLQLADFFESQQINFVSIENNIDTSTAMGRFFFTVMGAFAEMEAELIRERVMAGLEAARDNGKTLGRPSRTKAVTKAMKLYQETELPVSLIARRCRLSIPTVYNHLQKQGIPKRRDVKK
ncbi:recombinase family protein [uncultured Vagococcus sp.]|uniref:recombinase family protein n=1 Tax=uncultured Vagococcus sp. TaxID=189676 RepID=UPI0028D69350|nr:recombinase family protein [uncultured Vagococcus sp.]